MAINGIPYSFESIEVTFQGKMIEATGIKYTTKRDVQPKYVLGRSKPAAIIKGAKESTGELTITHGEIIRLQSAIPAGSDLTDIQGVVIIVKFQDEQGKIFVDRLENVVFTETGKEFKAENPNWEYTLPIHIGNILYNA